MVFLLHDTWRYREISVGVTYFSLYFLGFRVRQGDPHATLVCQRCLGSAVQASPVRLSNLRRMLFSFRATWAGFEACEPVSSSSVEAVIDLLVGAT